jgi:4-amino-4-deoxy-L-arabinose transferase-like glycosyltransferase
VAEPHVLHEPDARRVHASPIPPVSALNRDRRRVLERHAFGALLAVAFVMCLAGIFQHGLWTPDEPREAEIGREMLMSGWSPVPMLDGQAFLEKPPLFPWIMAAFYALFGVHPGVARLPAALFSIGTILVAYHLGRRAGGRTAGLASAVVLATSLKFAEISHCSINDTALTFFVAAGHLAFLSARDRERLGEKSFGLVLAGLCAGLAFLTKSLIGPVLVAGPPLLAAALMREWRFLRFAVPRAALWCTLFVVALGLPWVLALASSAGWSAVRVCLIDNTLGRSVSANPEFGHANGPFLYVGTFPLETMPWMLVLPAALMGRTLVRDWRAGRGRFLALLVLSGLVILSLPATKRGLYALPLYPSFAVVAGVWLSRAGSARGSRIDRPTLVTLTAVISAILLVTAVALAWIAFGGALPERMQSSVSFLRQQRGLATALGSDGTGGPAAIPWSSIASWVSVVLLAGGAGLVLFIRALRARTASTPALAGASAAGALALFLIWHSAVQPLVDPLKDMGEGARVSMRDIPADEPLLGLALDETSRAIIPYYTGRFILNVATSSDAIEALEKGPSRHLVVMDNVEHKIDATLRAKLRPVSQPRLNAVRVLNVYRYEQKL